MAALRARHLQHRVRKATDGDHVLLEQQNDKDELYKVSGQGPKRLRE
jgi:hypothetical protein